MIQVRKFKPSDADILCPIALDSQVRENPRNWHSEAEINAANPAVTAYIDDTIIFATGIRLGEHKEGLIGNIWTILTPAAKKHKKELIRAERLLVKIWLKLYNLKWLYSESRKGFPASQRLLEHCGFIRTDIETEEYYIYKMKGN